MISEVERRHAKRRGFPFDRPLTHDWLWWWALIVGFFTILGTLVAEVSVFGPKPVALIVSLVVNFLVFVAPGSAVRAMVRAVRSRATHE